MVEAMSGLFGGATPARGASVVSEDMSLMSSDNSGARNAHSRRRNAMKGAQYLCLIVGSWKAWFCPRQSIMRDQSLTMFMTLAISVL